MATDNTQTGGGAYNPQIQAVHTITIGGHFTMGNVTYNQSGTGKKQIQVCSTRVPRNVNIEKLQNGYLFPEISMKQLAHMQKYPDAKLISFGIGETTQPLPDIVISAMAEVWQLGVEQFNLFAVEDA